MLGFWSYQMMMKLLRRLFFISPPAITGADVLAIGKAECAKRGLPWKEPVHIAEGMRTFRIMTNHGYRGGNVNLVIDAQTGEIKRAGFARQ